MKVINLKLRRHNKILEIINEKDIETQEELAEELKKAGFDVTQATVSRYKNIKINKNARFIWNIQICSFFKRK